MVPKALLGKNSRDTIPHKVKDQARYESAVISSEYQVTKANSNQGRRWLLLEANLHAIS
jgi:hypothetical protein